MPFIHVGGQWQIKQSNGFVVNVNVTQTDNKLDAFCSHSGGKVRSTKAKGFVENESFELTITWDNGSKGKYTGRLEKGHFTKDNEGILKGSTVDLSNPSSTATWEVPDRVFARL